MVNSAGDVEAEETLNNYFNHCNLNEGYDARCTKFYTRFLILNVIHEL